MFKKAAIKKYGTKLLPYLQKRYGKQSFYTARQVRATVFQCDFNPKYLPLGYLLFIEHSNLTKVLKVEFPNVDIAKYKQEMRCYLSERKYHGYLQLLIN